MILYIYHDFGQANPLSFVCLSLTHPFKNWPVLTPSQDSQRTPTVSYVHVTIYQLAKAEKQNWPLTIDHIENTDKKFQNWEMSEGLCVDLGLVWTWSCLQAYTLIMML